MPSWIGTHNRPLYSFRKFKEYFEKKDVFTFKYFHCEERSVKIRFWRGIFNRPLYADFDVLLERELDPLEKETIKRAFAEYVKSIYNYFPQIEYLKLEVDLNFIKKKEKV